MHIPTPAEDHLDLTRRREPFVTEVKGASTFTFATPIQVRLSLVVMVILGFIAGVLGDTLPRIANALEALKPAPVSAPQPPK